MANEKGFPFKLEFHTLFKNSLILYNCISGFFSYRVLGRYLVPIYVSQEFYIESPDVPYV